MRCSSDLECSKTSLTIFLCSGYCRKRVYWFLLRNFSDKIIRIYYLNSIKTNKKVKIKNKQCHSHYSIHKNLILILKSKISNLGYNHFTFDELSIVHLFWNHWHTFDVFFVLPYNQWNVESAEPVELQEIFASNSYRLHFDIVEM